MRCNKASQKLLGLTEKQMLGKEVIDPVWKFCDEDGNEMPLSEYPVKQVLSTKNELKNFTLQINRLNKNDSPWVQVNAIPDVDSAGNISQVVVTFMDITERKVAEQALRIEKNNLKNVFESMKDGVYIVNQQFDVQYVNSALTKEFGDYEARKCYQYFYSRTEVCPWCKAIDVFAGKTVRWEWHSPKNQKDYELIASPLSNSDGSISKLEIFRDVTERKEQESQKLKLSHQEEELKRLESLKTMAGAVAHRFNNSMQAVLGYLEILDMSIAGDSPESKDVSNALQVANEASQVGSMMLTYYGGP